MQEDDDSLDAFDAGNDNQIDEAEADVATEIPQEEPTEALNTISNIEDADQGQVGDSSKVTPSDGGDSGSGSSTNWFLIIGGLLLVMALCAAGAYVYMNRKDADETQQSMQDTQMTNYD